jgi:hypothetical protein
MGKLLECFALLGMHMITFGIVGLMGISNLINEPKVNREDNVKNAIFGVIALVLDITIIVAITS